MDIWVTGAGAIGGVVAAGLARSNHRVLVIDRWQEHVDAMRTRGLMVGGRWGGEPVRLDAITPLELASSAASRPQPDWLLVAVKAQDTELAGEQAEPYLSDQTGVLCLQNGFGLRAIARRFGDDRSAGAMINWAADLMGPGEIQFGGAGGLYVGENRPGPLRPTSQALIEALQGTAQTHATEKLWGYLWSKMCYALYLIGSALDDQPLWAAAQNPVARSALEPLIGEGVALARARGVVVEPYGYFEPRQWHRDGLDATDSDRFWRACADRYANQVKQYSGVWRDLKVHRRPAEGTHQVGEMLAMAAEIGFETPRLACLHRLLKEIESSQRVMTADNFAVLNAAT